MQCKNCGKAERAHEARTHACPLANSAMPGLGLYHKTQRLEPHRQCKHKRDGICGKPGPCFSPAYGG